MKIKLKDIRKQCPDGDIYTFKNGVATVPGMHYKNRKPYTITLKEFKEMCDTINLNICESL
jgi:hypothetical protein